jgi:fumarylacetoacetase
MKRSFVSYPPESPFPIQNIPFGVFSAPDRSSHIGVAIGDQVLDLSELQKRGLLAGDWFQSNNLNKFLSTGRKNWQATRRRIQELLDEGTATLRDDLTLRAATLLPQSGVTMHLPVEIGDYTDFYSSREHATNVGAMFRDPANALLPNWLHLPVAYHGRASSVVVSGTPIRRPCGQTKADDRELPSFAASKLVDFELEVGCIIGTGNKLGEPIPVDKAHEHIFGMVLVNDWSARDIQKWEYVPLGPFLAKNLGTSISPWVVTLDALEEFRVAGPKQEPTPLPYLQSQGDWGYNIDLEVKIRTAAAGDWFTIVTGNFRSMYWNICQQVAHHTCGGCNLRTGDLLASGTISGSTPSSYGSLLELTWKGTKPIRLPSGEDRTFLKDGDSILMTGHAQGHGYTIGFGEVVGSILPAPRDERLIVER